MFDPVSKKLILSQDVIFDEKKRWNWEEKAATEDIDQLAPPFTVVYSNEVPNGTAAQNPTTELLQPFQSESFQGAGAGE